MNDITKENNSQENAKDDKTAAKLEKAIQSETARFNDKIKKLGTKAGMDLVTEVHIIIK